MLKEIQSKTVQLETKVARFSLRFSSSIHSFQTTNKVYDLAEIWKFSFWKARRYLSFLYTFASLLKRLVCIHDRIQYDLFALSVPSVSLGNGKFARKIETTMFIISNRSLNFSQLCVDVLKPIAIRFYRIV